MARKIGPRISALLYTSLMGTALASQPVQARSVTYDLDIPAERLVDALQAFALASRHQLLYTSELVEGKSSPPLKGRYTTEQAMTMLLTQTKLKFEVSGESLVLIRANDLPAVAPELTPLSSIGNSKGGQKPSSGEFLVAQVDQRNASAVAPVNRPVEQTAKRFDALEEIVVTATRREENINTVAIAVTALTSADLRAKGIQTAQDLQNYVPSLSVSSSVTRDDYTFSLRGMGPTGGSGPGAVLGGGGTGVVAYFAEVPTPAAGPGLFYDLQNVQVAEGPQGTLFGKNTTGGVILFVPKKPTNDFEGFVEVGGGNYAMKTATAVVNIPVIDDKLLVRISAQYMDRNGFTVDRGTLYPGKDYDNRNYWTGRLSVVFRPIDSVENYTIFTALRSNENGDGFVLTAVNPSGPFAGQLLPILAQQQAAGVRSTSLSDPEIDKRFNFGVFNTTRWSVTDNLQFKNIFSYQVQKWRNSEDEDGTDLVLDDLVAPRGGGWHTQVGTYTDEPQVQGTAFGGNLKYTAGAYYEDGRNIANQPYEVDVAEGGFIIQQATQSNSERSRGLYGQTTYDLGGIGDQLKGLQLTTGYRYTWDDYSYGIGAYSPSAGNICLTSPGIYPAADCSFTSSGKSDGSSWTLGLDYQLPGSTLLYIRSGRGYVPGGFNPSFGFTPGGVNTPQYTFAPESVVDVELGVKSQFTIGSAPAQIAADVFHSDFTNIQRLVSETLPGGVASSFTTNASKAEIDGLEFQGSVAPTSDLKISATYSFNNGKYTQIDPAAAPSLVGVPFSYLPKHKASFSTTYALPVADSMGDVSLAAVYSYQSRFFDAPAVQPFDYIEGYGLLNVRADWNDILRSNIDLSFFVTNATDKTYRVGQYNNYLSNGYITSLYGEPRLFGAQLRYKFGPLSARH